MDTSESPFVRLPQSSESFPFSPAGSVAEFNNNPQSPQSENAFSTSVPMSAETVALDNPMDSTTTAAAAASTASNNNSANSPIKPETKSSPRECSFYKDPNSNKYSSENFTSCFESISRQLSNMPSNGPFNTSIQKAMYEMYNMSAMNDTVNGENETAGEARNSVLEAILEIEFCNIPLRQEVINFAIAAGDPSFKKPLKYADYLRIEANPTLHNIELERLEELKNACTLLRNPYKHVVHKTNQLGDAVKVTEAAIRRLIKMSKRLSAFNKLSQNDQISLLKGSIIEMMCIRATTNFNCVVDNQNLEHNFWYFIDDNNQGLTMVSLDVLKNANWINFMSHKNFALKFNSQFKNDPMIADLLTAIILFRPSRASTNNQELIRDEFLNYCYLLKRYLYVNSSGDKCKAKSHYIVLMHRLEELYYLAEDIVRIYLDMDPDSAGPLFVELFDLK